MGWRGEGMGGTGKKGEGKKKKKLHFKDGLFTWRKGAKKGEGPWKVWKEWEQNKKICSVTNSHHYARASGSNYNAREQVQGQL